MKSRSASSQKKTNDPQVENFAISKPISQQRMSDLISFKYFRVPPMECWALWLPSHIFTKFFQEVVPAVNPSQIFQIMSLSGVIEF